MTRQQAGFAGVVRVPHGDRWPRPRGFASPTGLDAGIETLAGVGPTLAKRLRALGIASVADLLFHRPRRYERAADEVAISQLWGDGEVVISGVVQDVRTRRLAGGRRSIVIAVVRDDSGSISASWFNQPWLLEKLVPGTSVRLRGKLGKYGFDVKSYDLGDKRATADFAPVYPASEAVPSTRLRELVRAALAEHLSALHETLPAELGLPLRRDALGAVHFPVSEEQAEEARRRLALDELVALQLVVARSRRDDAVAVPLDPAGELIERYRGVLPFELTRYQESAIEEIDRDLGLPVPMRRLLQGDVGSGKTVVALYALLRAVETGSQGALMAPDRDAGRAALSHSRAALHGARRPLGAAHRLGGLGQGARRDRHRRSPDRGRDARADPAPGRVRRPRRGRGRRTAPLRRRAASGARRGTLAARPAHDGHPDSAHPRAHDLRRPRGERDREAAREPQADRDGVGGGRAFERGLRAPARAPRRRPAGVRRLPPDRAVGGAAGPRGRGGGRPAAPRRARRVPHRPPAREAPARRAPRGDASVQGASSSTCSSRRR